MSRLKTEGLLTLCGGPFAFAVERGECLALSGPSGCGKTLLLRALADLDLAEGTVLLDGENRDSMPAPQWRRKVGWLPAESSWWAEMVRDHFRDQRSDIRGQQLPNLENHSRSLASIRGSDLPRRDRRFFLNTKSTFGIPQVQCLEKLGFQSDVLGWKVERLSTGEKQRLALFRLLLNEPQVLLLDEPTAALDVSNVWKAEEVIADYRKATGAAVVWVSHNPEQIARVADRHLIFTNGGLEAAE